MRLVSIINIIFVLIFFVKSSPILNEQAFENEEDTPHKHPYGRPLNVLRFDDHEQIIIENEELDNIFLHPEVKDRKIVAISIIGAFRKGKSFLMDYALRYMYGNYKSIAYRNNPLDKKNKWIGEPDEPLKGFSWRSGTVRDTTGVIMWSDVFLHEDRNNKYAIILMDTQGLFDTKTSPTDNSRIFALGTLLSSVQIFNLNDVIQENQLEYLQLATDFAKLAMKKNREFNRRAKKYKPFQHLVFLMRDWQNKDEFDYGLAGGAGYLETTLQVSPSQPVPLQNVRKYIKESFEKTYCFLLPHPGQAAVNNKQYDGRWSVLDEEFVTNVKDFLNWLLATKNLQKKQVLNVDVTGTTYLEYMKMYFEAFLSDDIPKFETIYAITVRKQFEMIVQEAFQLYKSNIKPIEFNENGELKELEAIELELKENHEFAKNFALKLFKEKKKLGSENDEKYHETNLISQMDGYYNDYRNSYIVSYMETKNLQKRLQEEIEKQKKEHEETARIEREKHEAEKRKVEEEFQVARLAYNKEIENAKNLTDVQVAELKEQFKKQMDEAEKQKKAILDQIEEERLKMKEQERIAAEKTQNQLNEIIQEFEEKKKLMQQEIEDKKQLRLEELRLQAEERKTQFEQQLKIEASRQQAISDQRKYEQEQRAEERRIRAEEAARQREEIRKLDAQRDEERRRIDAEQKAAQEERDRRYNEMMQNQRLAYERQMRELQNQISNQASNTRQPFNLVTCVLSVFTSC